MSVSLDDIRIRTDLRAGDIGYIIYLHGLLYSREYDYGVAFESYVASGLHEFYQQYQPDRERIWICEHNDRIIGFLLLMNRGQAAQLRYFLIRPAYRGFGLGKKLMEQYMHFLRAQNYTSAYLWTTHELHAAASLYKRYGFELVDEKPSHAFGKGVIEQRYELILSPIDSDQE